MEKTKIKRISKFETKGSFTMHVNYESGRKLTFTEKDNLPETVWKILVDKETPYSVRYLTDFAGIVTRHETWTPKN